MGSIKSRFSGRVSPTKVIEEPPKPVVPPSNKFLVIWLDVHVNDADDVYQNSLARLQRLASSIHTFTEVSECLKYLTTKTNNEKVLMVISNALLPEIWPRVRSLPQIHSVYILSPDGENLPTLLDPSEGKVKGIFTKVEPICGSVKRDNLPCRPDALVMSVIPSSRYTKKDLPRLNQLFLYWMLVKLIVRDLKFDRQTRSEAVKDLASMSRRKHFADERELKVIDEFEQTYHLHSPIWWYTRECFIAPMLSQALQTRDIEVIIRMSFFLKDLFQQMEKGQVEGQKNATLPLVAYRSQQVSTDDFEKIKNIQGNLLSFNNFVIADPNFESSLDSIRASRQSNRSGVSLLFALRVDSKHTSNPYLALEKLSYSPEQGRLFLFSMHSVFRIAEIRLLEEGIYQIDLLLTGTNDEQIVALTDLLRQETRTAPNWLKLAQLISIVRDYEQAKEIYFTLLQFNQNEPLKIALIYNELGLLHDEQGDYASALIFYQRAIDIRREQLPPNHRSLSVSYNNIGEVQRQLGDYFNALDNHRKTLQIKQKILSPNNPSLATTYNNIGLANESLGEFATALNFYQKALDIKQKVLPADHQELAITYNNIGELHRLMGNFPSALTNLEQALHIRLKKHRPTDSSLAILYNNLGLIHRELGNCSTALSYIQKSLDVKLATFTADHPSLAFSYNNLGDIHQQLGECANALAFHQKALDIQEKVFGGNHPDVAATYTNLGAAQQAMGNYSQALAFYERAVEIRLKALPAVHPSLGTCYNNIGHVYQMMGQNSTALQYYQKTLKIQEKTLKRDHPSLAATYNNLADIQRKLENFSKALSLYKKSLEIKRKSLPADHPSLVITYNNIGVVHQSTGNYSAAIESFQRTLEVQKKTLSADHPDLAAVYNNIGVTRQAMKDYPSARECYQKALRIQEKYLRVDHPEMATTHNSLATVLIALGEFDEALEHEQRAVQIASATLSADHPNLKIFRSYLEQITKLVQSRQKEEQ